MWDVKESKFLADGEPAVTLRLEDSSSTRTVWGHHFVLELTVALSDRLRMTLKIINCGTVPMYFYAGFHPYLRVADITRTEILGLKDITFMDLMRERKYGVQNLDTFDIEEQTDRAYLNAPDTVTVRDSLMNRSYTISKQNIKDLVVWNPWEDGSRAIGDLGAQEYLSFVCVEPVIVNQKITLDPREKYECMQEISFR